ncbi:MAG: SHOCT domain-containing protein, partial [Bdellovibrionales bacterium]|nr:SHOCT domain-containing protein [Bdellovibrionales bacterium]
MKNFFVKTSWLLSLVLFGGCASILSGKSQTITITTNPEGARCELIREGRIIGTVENTPGAVTINKTKHDIDVNCKKDGFTDSKAFADSGTEGSTFANIILGGGIGWAIDSAAGADNKYPETVTVNLVPVQQVAAATTQVTVQKSASNTVVKNDAQKRLDDIKKMKDEGYLTEEEYRKKRTEIIGRL